MRIFFKKLADDIKYVVSELWSLVRGGSKEAGFVSEKAAFRLRQEQRHAAFKRDTGRTPRPLV